MAAGWSWGVLLVAFFVSSTALSRFREETKAARLAGIVAKGGARDALQVLANGGPFAAAALLFAVTGWPGWLAAGGGALASATADTWGTEIGALARHEPRSILTGRRVPTGTSGGVTLLGTAASVVGALAIAIVAWRLGWPSAAALGAAVGGVVGALGDSLLGATVQARRWCASCGTATERPVHDCGAPSEARGGLRWLDNDGVNLASGLLGAAAALLAA